MDNAPYHNVLVEDAFPQRLNEVKRLREWLSNNEIPWTKDMLKSELFELCSSEAAKPEFLIDRIANVKGHSILRTPPAQKELQPIETCWAIVKMNKAQHNDFTLEKVWILLEEGFAKVTNKTCQKLIKKVNLQEDTFWNEETDNFL